MIYNLFYKNKNNIPNQYRNGKHTWFETEIVFFYKIYRDLKSTQKLSVKKINRYFQSNQMSI